MVDRVNDDLEQDILRQGLQVTLIICDSEAMYDEVYQLKAQAYQVLESERVAMERDMEEFQRRVPSRNELGKYINHMKELVGKQHAYIA